MKWVHWNHRHSRPRKQKEACTTWYGLENFVGFKVQSREVHTIDDHRLQRIQKNFLISTMQAVRKKQYFKSMSCVRLYEELITINVVIVYYNANFEVTWNWKLFSSLWITIHPNVVPTCQWQISNPVHHNWEVSRVLIGDGLWSMRV